MNEIKPRKIVPVDFDETRRPTDYAPPVVRNAVQAEETTVEQISSFTRDVDQLVAEAKTDLISLEQQAQDVRKAYIDDTARVAADIRRLQEKIGKAKETMRTLQGFCAQVDEGSFPAK